MTNEVALPSNPKYKKVLKDLMVQGCIKLLEDKVLIKIRQKDLEIAKAVKDEAEREFKALMAVETKTDNYSTEIVILESDFIDPDSPAGKCGGIILMNADMKITCENTLDGRLQLTYDESLPHLRKILFPLH